MISEKHGNMLRYCSPYHGGWDIARMALALPESRIMFVCPASCARIISLNALRNGIKDRVSVFGLDEEDIVSGDYERLTIDAARELLLSLKVRPKIFILFGSCIDSMLGTDHKAQTGSLSELFPDITFTFFKMNPICRESHGEPIAEMMRDMYALLPAQRVETDRAVGFIGSNVFIEGGDDISALLGSNGYDIRHLSRMSGYDEFLRLRANSFNLVPMPFGVLAAQLLKTRFGTDFAVLPPSYDPAVIVQTIKGICDRMGIAYPDLQALEDRAHKALSDAAKKLSGLEIVIGSSASLRPLGLALLLREHGFNVKAAYIDSAAPTELEELSWLKSDDASFFVVDSGHIEMPDKRGFEKRPCLAIGLEAACYHGADRALDLFCDSGLWGFSGMCRLADRILTAAMEPLNAQNAREVGLL